MRKGRPSAGGDRFAEPRYREVAVLHYLEQMDVAQIADVTGVRRNTVEVRLHRARQQLKELLTDLVE